jgi:iron(III) transport system ATP-binding protein
MKPYAVVCRGLKKNFGGKVAVDGVDLVVKQGDIMAVIGPSGCGKTTLLRLIAGFEYPDEGKVVINGRVMLDETKSTPPEQRGVGMVFQEHALFPHLTVGQNVAFGLNRKSDKKSIIQAELERVGLSGYENRYPHELSGGERQRVALARALAPKPALVLLDEPFSNLDAERRESVREDVRSILKNAGAAAIFVTHDQEEALFMGDCMAVLNKGRVDQVGLPEEIFQRPSTRFVAEFMGQTNFLPAEVTADGLVSEAGLIRQMIPHFEGEFIEIVLRPDDVVFEPSTGGQATILARHFKGASYMYRLRLSSGQVLHSIQPHTCSLQPGAAINVKVDPGHDLAWFRMDN